MLESDTFLMLFTGFCVGGAEGGSDRHKNWVVGDMTCNLHCCEVWCSCLVPLEKCVLPSGKCLCSYSLTSSEITAGVIERSPISTVAWGKANVPLETFAGKYSQSFSKSLQ